jgi:hypothetical protein
MYQPQTMAETRKSYLTTKSLLAQDLKIPVNSSFCSRCRAEPIIQGRVFRCEDTDIGGPDIISAKLGRCYLAQGVVFQ